MLGKTKGVKEEPVPVQRPTPSGGKTVIGEQISMEGNIRGREDLVIEGSVKGSIALERNHLTVGPKGKVDGEIQAENVTVSGRLAGNIQAAGKVEITKDADFSGEIKAKRISVEDGAYIKAVIELERDSKEKTKPTPQTASGPSKPPIAVASEAERGK